MKFEIIGNGDFQNGNASSYFIENKKYQFLIDCGDTTFRQIKNRIDRNKKLVIFITHLHNDHAGSLGSLVLFSYYINKVKPIIHLPDNEVYVNNIKLFLKLSGVNEDLYTISTDTDLRLLGGSGFHEIKYIPTLHQTDYLSYGILFNLINSEDYFLKHSIDNNDMFYISGDTIDIPIEILNLLSNSHFKFMIQDVSLVDNYVHISIDKIRNIITNNKEKVFLTHSKFHPKYLGFSFAKEKMIIEIEGYNEQIY